jgi:hypothetical protein
MTKEDIIKLESGRVIVDRFRAVAKEYQDAVALPSSTEEIQSKFEAREAATVQMYTDLFNLGFGDSADPSSYQALLDFNKAMVFEEYKDMVSVEFLGCNGCPTLKCIELFGAAACVNTPNIIVDDKLIGLLLSLSFKSSVGKAGLFSDVSICPPNFGIKWTQLRNPRFYMWWK